MRRIKIKKVYFDLILPILSQQSISGTQNILNEITSKYVIANLFNNCMFIENIRKKHQLNILVKHCVCCIGAVFVRCLQQYYISIL